MIKKLRLGAIVLVVIAALSAFSIDYFEVNKQLELFTGIYKEVNLNYVDDTEPRKLMEDAVKGMLKNLDPYTVYIPEDKIEDYRMMQTGQYGGIGATIRKIGDNIYISAPHKGFPADKAGLKAGDWIKAVDGINMAGKTPEQVSEVLKGTPGTEVTLQYERAGKVHSVTLKREEIQLECVPYFGMIDDETGYIYLDKFTNKASSSVQEALAILKKNENLKQVVLDLRGNPGGLLEEAVNITNLFVEKGTEVVRMKGRSENTNRAYNTLRNSVDNDIKLAVLVSGSSASASEIVAGAIQDLDRGIIVGQRSFGKGLVQQVHRLPYESQIKVTIAKYYTPSGRCIQAINYAERSTDGKVEKLPDSLRTAFKTANGRNVFDGGGIDPDVSVEPEEASSILISLITKGHIFAFATEYAAKHPTIAEPEKFVLTDADYADFVAFLADKNYEYTTQTEKKLAQLIETADDENYKDLEQTLAELEKQTNKAKQNDLERHKAQIKYYLEKEIVGRYYYQSGEIRYTLVADPDLKAAIEKLKNTEEYRNILAGAN